MKKRKLVEDDDDNFEDFGDEFKSSVVNQIIDLNDDENSSDFSPLQTITTPINHPNNPKKPKIQSTLTKPSPKTPNRTTTPIASSSNSSSTTKKTTSVSTPISGGGKSNSQATTTPKRELKLVKKVGNDQQHQTPNTPKSLNVNTNKSNLGSSSNSSSSSKKQTLSPATNGEEKKTPKTLGDLIVQEKKKAPPNSSRKKFWNIAHCQPVNYKDFEDWEEFVDTAEEKYLGSNRSNSNVYIREDEVDVLYRWIDSFKSAKSTLSARVARNVKERSDNSFDERVEEEQWKKLNRFTTRLKNLLLKHENFTTDDLVKMRECNQVRKKRVEEEKREHEQSEREHEALKNQSDITQIKYFVYRDGPIRGQKEYFEWKSLVNMKGAFSKTLEKQKIEFGDSDDELLNGDLF